MNNSERPTNVEVLDFIKSDALAQSIIKNGEDKGIEDKRAVAIRALEISANQLGRDADRISREAFTEGLLPHQTYEKLDFARCLATASNWLKGLAKSGEQPDGMEKHP